MEAFGFHHKLKLPFPKKRRIHAFDEIAEAIPSKAIRLSATMCDAQVFAKLPVFGARAEHCIFFSRDLSGLAIHHSSLGGMSQSSVEDYVVRSN
jgi:hypothetical protein